MIFFRSLLVAMIVILSAYTGVVVANHGMDLLTIFFADMAAMQWPGQFNLDFMFMLALSALWVLWRQGGSLSGIGLAVCAFFGGALFLTLYLLVLSVRTQGDVRKMLLGRHMPAH